MEFHKRFDIDIDYEEATRLFKNRIYNAFQSFLTQLWREDEDSLLKISILLGEPYNGVTMLVKLLDYAQSDFYKCLKFVEATYATAPSTLKKEITDAVRAILELSEVDLEIKWNDGKFNKTGAKLLDEALINEPLEWLSERKYKDVRAAFSDGLSDFLHSQAYPERLRDTVRDMYEALENMARIVCGNEQNLGANAEQFVRNLGLSPHYIKMLREHTEYAHDFRHAPKGGKPRQLPSPEEVEALIYTTGLFLRLAIERLASK